MLTNARGHWVQHHELYPLLDIPGSTLPDAGFYKTIRTGLRIVEYTCTPLGVTSASTARGGHRLKFRCDCGRWIPFGRAGQHLPKCQAYARTEAAFRCQLATEAGAAIAATANCGISSEYPV